LTGPGQGFRASPVPHANYEIVWSTRRLTIEAMINL